MKSRFIHFALAILAVTAFGANQAAAQGFTLPMMIIETDAFEDGGVIPLKYTSHGDNVQPDFRISGAPDTTVSYAILFHDIDVSLGGSTTDVSHWVAWNIPSANIAEGSLPEGSVHGANITGQNAYFGPGAPSNERFHHYVFEFYALGENLDIPVESGRAELLAAMEGKVVAKAAYVGRYTRAIP
ncbi:YbhB/YbcL family Raf kinase inhibitor-like protein [Gammaproteobacteria bacterium]|nr:YbhB/YbcL family Raf kinase inhibitor-like protein [Gammaproteobacteria bacterium]